MKTHIKRFTTFAICTAMFASGCILRSTEDYTRDVRAELETKNGDIRSCYDAQLASDPSVSGDVVVTFKVAKKSGTITDVAVDPSSTAPAALSDCIATSIDGLALDPGDMAPAEATYTYRFKAG